MELFFQVVSGNLHFRFNSKQIQFQTIFRGR